MSVWRWVRSLRWGWQALAALLGVPLLLVLLYVGGRSLQYLVAGGDAGLYAPDVPALLRARDLDAQMTRMERTFAWNTIERKLLRDPAIRPRLNAALKDAGLPSLDELLDPRKRPFSRSDLSRFAGRDVVIGVGPKNTFCAATRLGWLEYLGAPFAPLVLARDGDTLRAGKKLWVAFAGAVAVAGNDKALVEAALLGRGRPPDGRRPLEAVVRFEGPFATLRDEVAGLGLLPHLKLSTAKAARVSADLDGSAARIDAVLEGVELAYPGQAPPNEFLARAPSSTCGVFASPASFGDLYAWAKTKAGGSLNARQAFETLEKGGMSERLLPLVEPGIALLMGYQENEGRLFPALALHVRTSDPSLAADALTAMVKKIGGKMGEARFEERPVGDTLLRSVRWPESAGINDFLQPCWAAVEGGLLFGNNPAFTEAVILAGDVWGERKIARRLGRRLRELGFAEAPGVAGGRLLPPLLRESLDGVIQYASRVMAVPSDAALRQALEREWAEQGRSALPELEKAALFLEAREAKIADFEAETRRSLRGLDPVRWLAFESGEVPGGVSLRLAIGFDTLSDR